MSSPTAEGVPTDFQFSQASLQDFVDCRRRFQLRYVLELAWPAVEAEPADEYEDQLLQGEAFHRLVHQHQLGVPAELLTKMAQNLRAQSLRAQMAGSEDQETAGDLVEWWAHYLEDGPSDLPAAHHSEVTLSAPLGGHRLVAKYDLIAVEPGGRAVIVDWKTSQKRTAQEWLAARLQTRVYRYLLVRACPAEWYGTRSYPKDAGHRIEPAQVEMIYWFANYPGQPERLRYDEVMYGADEAYLATLIAEIKHADDVWGFPLTDDVWRHCRFCTYRSLCDRGVEAGELAGVDGHLREPAEDLERLAGFNFEQIGEIAY